MSLNWNIEKCKEVDEIKSKGEWVITNTIIWATMPVAMGSITESNWREFLFRIKVIEKLAGPFMNQAIPNTDPPEDGKVDLVPVLFTPEMIKKRIGLYTNVSTETRAKWMKGYVNNLFQNIDREIDTEVSNG